MKIAVLTSGGVDSSVALKLLQQQGHDLTAFYLKIWLEDELAYLGDCPWEEDLAYVQKICSELKIPLEVMSLQKEYYEEVVSYSLKEIKEGRTPNSDLFCNSKVKFGKFYERIPKEFDLIATGHYAQKIEKNGKFYLQKAKDTFKDQTYFLAHLSQSQLAKAIFPLGNLLKSEVRELAKEFELPNAARKDSQGICFLGQIKYTEFVRHHLGEKKGDLIDFDTGQKAGEHKGYWFYTIGQRKGIELSGGPWFVVKKDIHKNQVFISKTYHDPSKSRNNFKVGGLHWITTTPTPQEMQNLQVKIRHGENLYNARLEISPDNNSNGEVWLSANDQGLAPGQFAVFYSDNICLGCGMIE